MWKNQIVNTHVYGDFIFLLTHSLAPFQPIFVLIEWDIFRKKKIHNKKSIDFVAHVKHSHYFIRSSEFGEF
jgi:hypothetical protein